MLLYSYNMTIYMKQLKPDPFMQRGTVEFGWGVRQGDQADTGPGRAFILSTEDEDPRVSDEGDEDASDLPQHHEDVGLQEGCTPLDLQGAGLYGGEEEISVNPSGLQPLVPPRSSRYLERDPLLPPSGKASREST